MAGRAATRRGLLASGAALALSGIGRPAGAKASAEVVRFGVSTAGVGSPPRVATGWVSVAQVRRVLEQELEADGIRVEWTFFKGQGPAVNEALGNEQLDFSTLGDLPSVIGRSVGIRAKLVLVTSSRTNAFVAVKPSSTARSVKDLVGRRVAYHKGTSTQLAAARIFELHGLTERDFKVINLEPASSLAAFASGDIDGIVGSLSLATLRDKGLARILYNTRQTPRAGSSGHILVSERYAAQNPALTQRVVTALTRAAHWASLDDNRAEVLRLWASAGSIGERTWQEEFDGVPLAQRLSPRFDRFVIDADRRTIEDAYRFKLIRKRFDVNDWIDTRYVDTAVKTLKLENFWAPLDATGRPLPTAAV